MTCLFADNLRLHSILQLQTKVEKDGQKYLEIKNATFTHSYDGKVTYSMTNLFRRNPEISELLFCLLDESNLTLDEKSCVQVGSPNFSGYRILPKYTPVTFLLNRILSTTFKAQFTLKAMTVPITDRTSVHKFI